MKPTSSYKIVFSGNILQEFEEISVKEKFATTFRIANAKTLNKLFSGSIHTIKSGLSYKQAQHYQNILLSIGADCCIEIEQNIMNIPSYADDEYEREKQRRLSLFTPYSLASASLVPKSANLT